MTVSRLNQIWQVVDSMRPEASELSVHSVGIHSNETDVCLGRDRQGRRHLLIPLPPNVSAAPQFKSSGLFVRTRPLFREDREHPFLDLVCLTPGLNDVFSHLVFDVLHDMRSDEPDAAEICGSVLEAWKGLFGPGSSEMGMEQITGLVGELLVLERLTKWNPHALAWWDGPMGGIHDFRTELKAIEVKTSTRRHGRLFAVSGHQQLEAPRGGTLHLVAIKLEHNSGGLISIPHLLDEVRRNGVDPALLLQRLNEAGYSPGANMQADSSRFDVSECLFYQVTSQFPRIVASSFVEGQPPSGIIGISYQIDLSGPVPSPLSDELAEAIVQEFATRGAA